MAKPVSFPSLVLAADGTLQPTPSPGKSGEGSAVLARQLIHAGYRHVRVLTGGNDAIAMLNAVASVA